MAKDIIVVTAAYGNDTVTQSGGQIAFLDIIKNSGADGVEIRQELLQSSDNIDDIAKKINKLNLSAVYSVPKSLFDSEGKIALETIKQSLNDAQILGASKVKLSLGHLPSDYNLSALSALLSSSTVQLVIENDQTAEGGHIKSFIAFFKQVKQQDVAIKMTFDMANWCWHGEDAISAAKALAPYVAYIHVKACQQKNQKMVAVALDDSDGHWKDILSLLPNDVPRGIEFPLVNNDLIAITQYYVEQLKGF